MKIFYKDDMAPIDLPGNYSKSPSKPRRFIEFLRNTRVWDHVELSGDFNPINRDQMLLAHEERYVDAFLTGEGHLAGSSRLKWSPKFRDSVLLTNGCLLHAIEAAIDEPHNITMAPVSGFHHARPDGGSGFCALSGQVISAIELYRKRGLRGAWVDLDGHFGNSIGDTVGFAPDVAEAIQVNINPEGRGERYLFDLSEKMYDLKSRVVSGEVDYICVAHGADSHEWDQLGGQVDTEEWLRASDIVYRTIQVMRFNRPNLPVTLSLFGGYRDDHPESVLGLHAMDVASALRHLGGVEGLDTYREEVRQP